MLRPRFGGGLAGTDRGQHLNLGGLHNWWWSVHAREFWTNLTLAFACLFFWREVPELRKPRPETPIQDGTYTAWWKWVLGIEPRHWRRWILVPIFSFATGWFPMHVLLDIGPKVRQ